nr:MAG TPA: DNA-directed RNA polymerase subunit alpha [Caudoviricetes sp.]
MTPIERRLENWGEWGRSNGSRRAQTSPLYQLYRANCPEYTIEPQISEVDNEDAYKVDRAIARACLPYERELLRMRYVGRRSLHALCNRMKVGRREIERMTEEAQRKVGEILENLNS